MDMNFKSFINMKVGKVKQKKVCLYTGIRAGEDVKPEFSGYFIIFFSGVYSEMATPVPIPNTEVKHFSGDGTAYKSVGEQHDARDFFCLKAV